MQLSNKETKLIRESYLAARDEIEKASVDFYNRLFDRSAEIKQLFRTDMDDQGMRFMTALGVIILALDEPKRLAEALDGLGQGHAALGIRVDQYAIMTDVLVETLAAHSGEHWSQATEVAWRHALDQVAEGMTRHIRPAA
ncbi:MAG: globin domain-containing protein [Pseudomonadota bacterium]